MLIIIYLTAFLFVFDSQEFIKAVQQTALCSAPSRKLHWLYVDTFVDKPLWHAGVVFPPKHAYISLNADFQISCFNLLVKKKFHHENK